jgi:hypothetical protein
MISTFIQKSTAAVALVGLLFVGAGCAPANTSATQEFGVAKKLVVNDSVSYSDGLSVKLEKIEDSRCKPDVQCIWQGELAPVFVLSGGEIGAEAQTVRMGTERAKEVDVHVYHLALGAIDTTTATIVVTKNSAPVTIGDNKIRVSSPKIGETVTSPLTVTGSARGTWYFEASFPVKLLDANGKVLAIAPAQAQGDWMTEEFVPFSVTLTFAKPTTATGTLVLEKDNPSGLPEHDDSRTIPVKF